MRLACVLVLVAACQGDGDDEYPVIPGGGGSDLGVVGGGVDAGVDGGGDAGDGGALITGRVCLLLDLRVLSSCANSGAGGLVVTLGDQLATTDDAGVFAITVPAGINLVWRVTSVAGDPDPIRRSVVPFGASTLIPAIEDDTYTEIATANGALLTGGQGSIILRIVRGATLVAEATATAIPVAQGATLYDGPDELIWGDVATGLFGIAWLPVLDLGATTVSVTPPVSTPVLVTLPVEDQAITFATINVL